MDRLRIILIAFVLVGCATAAPAPQSPPDAVSSASPAAASAGQSSAAGDPVEIRLICLAPSPYTHRHDALRAGFGIFLSLRRLIAEHRLPLRIRYHDGAALGDDRARIEEVLRGAQVLVLGGSTWSQGPAPLVRRFFELGGSQYLGGVSASAWATAGGAHTGGEEVVSGILRSFLGMGAEVFTLGQKHMVFVTDERVEPLPPGAFSLFDLWYMDQFARRIAVVALAGHDRDKARALMRELGGDPHYYRGDFPPDEQALSHFRELQRQLNAAADPASDAYRQLRSMLE